MLIENNMSLRDLERKYRKKKISKVSPQYLKNLCHKYGLRTTKDFKDHLLSINGVYKGILKKIEEDYGLFEKFVKNYILINRALALMGEKTTCHQVFNIFFVRDHLNLFIMSTELIDRSRDDMDYIELKFKLEEEKELGEV